MTHRLLLIPSSDVHRARLSAPWKCQAYRDDGAVCGRPARTVTKSGLVLCDDCVLKGVHPRCHDC